MHPMHSMHTMHQVFVFMCNDKGSTWAYSTPAFGAMLSPTMLKVMRDLAGLPPSIQAKTEVRTACANRARAGQ